MHPRVEDRITGLAIGLRHVHRHVGIADHLGRVTHRVAGQYKEAIGYYRQCNNFPSNYSEMAACHRAMKDYREAVILYSQIVGGAPNSAPWAMLQIGYTQEQAGNKEAAIKAFQQVCKNFPKDGHASQAHAHLQTEYKITVTLGGAKDE